MKLSSGLRQLRDRLRAGAQSCSDLVPTWKTEYEAVSMIRDLIEATVLMDNLHIFSSDVYDDAVTHGLTPINLTIPPELDLNSLCFLSGEDARYGLTAFPNRKMDKITIRDTLNDILVDMLADAQEANLELNEIDYYGDGSTP